MSNIQGFCFDLESDSFLFDATKIWDIHLRDLTNPEKSLHLNPYKDSKAKDKFIEFVKSYDERPLVVGHNILGFDMFILKCLLDINFQVGKKNGDTIEGIPVQFVDTWYWSMFLFPDRTGHSIEYFGDLLGLEKLDFRSESIKQGLIFKDSPSGAEFKQPSPLMTEYNIRDVDVNILVFNYLYKEHQKLYGREAPIASQAFKCGQKSFFLMSCQEYSGWKFDLELAEEVRQRLEQDMEEIRAEVEPQLPPRELKKGEQKDYTMPAKPFKKDGTYSANWLKWVEKHNGKDLGNGEWEFYGKKYSVEGGKMLDVTLPMEMANQDQMKDWFISQGWKPVFWNYKRGPDGKPMRDPVTRQLIPTSPKMQEQGKICPNLEAMEGDIVKKVVKWLSLRNRLSVLTGWMNHERLEYDGRLPGRRTGIAACFTADTLILTENGMRTWFQIEVGDKVVTHKNRLQPITDKFENGVKEVFEVTLENGIKTKLTANHPLLTPSGDFVKVQDICIGDEVMAYPENESWKQWNNSEIMVSSWGRVKNLLTGGEYSPHKGTGEKSLVVDIRHNGKRGTYRLARMVLDAHKGMGAGKHCLHRNDLPFDNYVGNLVEGTDKENGQDRSKYGVCAASARKRGNVKLDWSKVEAIRSSTKTNKTLALICGVSPTTISQVRNGHRWAKHESSYEEKKLSIVPVKVKSIVSIGYQMTYGVSVAEDETHLTDGIMTHNTHRQKHAVICNVPKASEKVLYGKEFRSLFTVEDGMLLAAADASALEGRVMGHYSWRYDDGETANEILNGDPHSKNAMAFYGHLDELKQFDISSKDFDKDHPIFKPYRDRSKNGFYALLYGCAAPKLASTLGLPEKMGAEKLEAFWEANPAIKGLKDNLERYWESKGQKKYLPAIDGRILHTRKKSALLNTIFQSCGGIIMDYATCFMDMWLGEIYWDEKRRPYYLYKGKIVRRVIYYHDEMSFECEEEVAEEVAQMIVKAIVKAGELLKLKVPLAGEGKVGRNWCETH